MKNFQLSIFNFQVRAKHALLLTLTALLLLTVVAACSEEEQNTSSFAGTDNYITAFVLQQGETVFDATIANKVITVTVPEDFLLAGAKAIVTLSENAKIVPDPAVITDWETEQLFTVIAYDGTRTKYQYTLKRTPIAHEGTVVLFTQADVDAFGAQGVTFIDGNLTIGRTAGTDSIFSLAPLESLREVAYNLTINPTCAMTGLEGLENLKRIGGMLQVGALPHLETLRLPVLETVDGIDVRPRGLMVVDLPRLTRVSQAMYLWSIWIAEVNLPSLQSAGSLTFTTDNNTTASLEELNFSELVEIGLMDINRFPELTRISLPKLKKAATLDWGYQTKLAIIYTPLLEEVTGNIYWRNLPALRELDFPKLSKVTSLQATSITDLRGLESASFPLITSINVLNLTGAGRAITGFTALQTAASVTLGLKEDDSNNIVMPSSMESIDWLKIFGHNNALESGTVDVRGVAINMLNYENYCGGITLIGDNVFHGALKLQPASTATANFPKIQGFSEIDSLWINAIYGNELHIGGIRKVNRGVLLQTGSKKAFSLLDLETIGGNATISINLSATGATVTTAILNDLTSVGGNLDLSVSSRSVETLDCPKLTTVGGNFTLAAGYEISNSSIGLKTLQFPELATIGGKLRVWTGTTSTSYSNTHLTNLDGFSALRSVQAVEITRMSNLTDYSGLKSAFETHPWGASNWVVNNNGWNPDYATIAGGQWKQ